MNEPTPIKNLSPVLDSSSKSPSKRRRDSSLLKEKIATIASQIVFKKIEHGDLLPNIFSFLNTQEFFNTVPRVCRLWNAIQKKDSVTLSTMEERITTDSNWATRLNGRRVNSKLTQIEQVSNYGLSILIQEHHEMLPISNNLSLLFRHKGSNRAKAEIWNLDTGKTIRPLFTGSTIKNVIISEKFLGGVHEIEPNKIFLWNLLDESSGVLELGGHGAPVTMLQELPEERLISTSFINRTMKIWDLKTRTSLQTLSGIGDTIIKVLIGSKGHIILQEPDKIQIWNLVNGRLLHTLQHVGLIDEIAISPCGEYLISADGTVKIWSVQSGELLYKPEAPLRLGLGRPIRGIEPNGYKNFKLTSEGRLLLWGAEDLAIRPDIDTKITIWDIAKRRALSFLSNGMNFISEVVSTNDSRVIFRTLQGTVEVWDEKTGTPIISFHVGRSTIYSIEILPTGHLLVDKLRSFSIWDINEGVCLKKIENPYHFDLLCATNEHLIFGYKRLMAIYSIWKIQTCPFQMAIKAALAYAREKINEGDALFEKLPVAMQRDIDSLQIQNRAKAILKFIENPPNTYGGIDKAYLLSPDAVADLKKLHEIISSQNPKKREEAEEKKSR